MKLAISPEQRQFFRKHHQLELEGLLKPEQLKKINASLEGVIAQRLNIKPDRAFLETSGRLYASGHDVWRSDETLKKLVLNSQFAELVSELIEFKPLRIGFDQFYPSLPIEYLRTSHRDSYREVILKANSLKNLSSVQGTLCGLLICLSGSTQEDSEGATETDPANAHSQTVAFPKVAGNGIVFTADAMIDFHTLLQKEPHRYLLITYAHPTSIYFFQESDPLTHEMKRLGYVFGDRLSDKLNPIVYR